MRTLPPSPRGTEDVLKMQGPWWGRAQRTARWCQAQGCTIINGLGFRGACWLPLSRGASSFFPFLLLRELPWAVAPEPGIVFSWAPETLNCFYRIPGLAVPRQDKKSLSWAALLSPRGVPSRQFTFTTHGSISFRKMWYQSSGIFMTVCWACKIP